VPDGRRDEARALLLSGQIEYSSARATMIGAERALIDALRMNPFDADTVAAALTNRQEASRVLGDIGSSQLAAIAQLLTDTERADMADRLEEQARRWTERQKK